MAFSQATIAHKFSNADGTPASGAVTFQLTGRMSQPGSTITPGEVTANLDASGNLAQPLTSNVDAGTIPQTTQWIMTIRLQGDSVEQYPITVPSGGGSVDLYSLLPQQAIGG